MVKKVVVVDWVVDYEEFALDIMIFAEEGEKSYRDIDKMLRRTGLTSQIVARSSRYQSGEQHLGMQTFLDICNYCNLDPRKYFTTR